MLRHKSIPCLLTTNNNIWNNFGCDINNYGLNGERNDLKDRYYNLQEQHMELKRDANKAQNQIRMLNTRLSRLLNEKKRFYKNMKSEREIVMEEKMFELERLLREQELQNERLKERLQLMRINSANPNHNFNHNHNQHSLSQSLNNLKSTANTTRISSAYSHVRSRTDSGLGFYFRPLNLKSRLRARSQTDLRSQQKSVNFQNTTNDFSDNLLAINTRALMQEAKEEIIRLESIVQKQQEMINSFRTGNFFVDPTAKNPINFNDNPSMLSYTIMTRTTTSNLTTTTTTADNNHTLLNENNNDGNTSLKTGDMITDGDLENNNDKILDSLWLKYQQILLHKENTQRISNECQQIIESLYLAVKEERKRYEFLKTKFNSLPTYTASKLNY